MNSTPLTDERRYSIFLQTELLTLSAAQQERALLRFESDLGVRLLFEKLTAYRRDLDTDHLYHARRHIRSLRRDIKHRRLIRQSVAEQREFLEFSLRSKRFFETQLKAVRRLLWALRMERKRRKKGGRKGVDWP